MSDEFSILCADVLRDTKWIPNYEGGCPHFQRALDYIHGHSSERDEIARILGEFVEGGGYVQISLVEFLMSSLRWPEIRIIAEARCAREGNMYWEVKHLLDVYDPVA